MKILWVSTSPIGPSGRILSIPYLGSSGSWIQTEYEGLEKNGVSMYFLCASPDIPLGEIEYSYSNEGEAYCVNLPKLSFGKKPPEKLKSDIESVIQKVNPDIIQIWGTESCISYLVSECCPDIKKVIYIQGLIGMHSRYMGGYIKSNEDKKYYRGVKLIEKLKTIVRNHFFKAQTYYEQKTLLNCSNIITDNNFTNAYCRSINNSIRSFEHRLHANELFKNETWDFSSCEKNSIFTVYGITPDKGLHQLLKATKIVKKTQKEIKVYIPGPYNIDNNGQLKLVKNMRPFERWMFNLLES
jgi:glycosyltransferase involved in cell wall biosynthesis